APQSSAPLGHSATDSDLPETRHQVPSAGHSQCSNVCAPPAQTAAHPLLDSSDNSAPPPLSPLRPCAGALPFRYSVSPPTSFSLSATPTPTRASSGALRSVRAPHPPCENTGGGCQQTGAAAPSERNAVLHRRESHGWL